MNILQDKAAELAFKKHTKVTSIDAQSAGWDELHAKRKEIVAGMRGMLDRADADKRNFNNDEEKAYSFGDALLDSINIEFSIREKAGTKDGDVARRAVNSHLNPIKTDRGSIVATESSPRSYRSIHKIGSHEELDTGGFEGRNAEERANDFYKSLQFGTNHAALQKRAFFEETGTLGGFVVADELESRIYSIAVPASIVMPRAQIVSMSGKTKVVTGWNDENRATSLYGGFEAEWLEEGGEGTLQTGSLRLMTLVNRKLVILCEASVELLEDSDMDREITPALSKTIAYNADGAFLTGNGVGKPLGIMNAPCRITIARTGVGAISYADIVNMLARLMMTGGGRPVWIANQTCIPQLLTMVAASTNQLVYQSAAEEGVPAKLLGIPFYTHEQLPALGSEGDLVLADFSAYAVGLRKGLTIEKSQHVGFKKFMDTYRSMIRIDGMPLISKPVQPRNGNTVSPFVVLGN